MVIDRHHVGAIMLWRIRSSAYVRDGHGSLVRFDGGTGHRIIKETLQESS